ncbi:MAG: biopolymer transporter ExbB [Paracoccaceae bacterium]|nr:biopolymer transporter ExbB [Paracoccaceae bacterium]
MVRWDPEAYLKFTQPVRQLVLMLFVLVAVGIGAWIAFPRVAPVFLANLWLNGFIAIVFLFGIGACFWQVFQIFSSVGWIEGFARERPGFRFTRAPRLLASLAALLRSRGKTMQIGASSTRSILDSVATRIDEARDITRYIVNLLIFLGLLGTFFGLATTVPAVVETIRSLAPSDNETGMEVFNRLMTGLESQLDGMGIAFSSSLLGLAGSLVVGLLELFASHGQNRFYRELEEWLSSITRLGFSADGDGEGGAADLGIVAQLAERMAERQDDLQNFLLEMRGEDRIGEMAGAIRELTDKLEGGQGTASALTRLGQSQQRLADLLEAQAQVSGGGAAGGVDAESRMRLRSMDVQLLRILEEMSAGRQESLSELRADIQALTRAVQRLDRTGG